MKYLRRTVHAVVLLSALVSMGAWAEYQRIVDPCIFIDLELRSADLTQLLRSFHEKKTVLEIGPRDLNSQELNDIRAHAYKSLPVSERKNLAKRGIRPSDGKPFDDYVLLWAKANPSIVPRYIGHFCFLIERVGGAHQSLKEELAAVGADENRYDERYQQCLLSKLAKFGIPAAKEALKWLRDGTLRGRGAELLAWVEIPEGEKLSRKEIVNSMLSRLALENDPGISAHLIYAIAHIGPYYRTDAYEEYNEAYYKSILNAYRKTLERHQANVKVREAMTLGLGNLVKSISPDEVRFADFHTRVGQEIHDLLVKHLLVSPQVSPKNIQTLGLLLARQDMEDVENGLPLLVEKIQNADSQVRSNVVSALGNSKAAQKVLKNRAKENEKKALANAIYSGLLGRLSDTDSQVRENAAFALTQLDAVPSIDITPLCIAAEKGVVEAGYAIQALAKTSGDCRIPALINALIRPDTSITVSDGLPGGVLYQKPIEFSVPASSVLRKIGQPAVMPLLQALLKQNDEKAGQWIYRTLTNIQKDHSGRTWSEEENALIVEVLRKDSPILCAYGAALLGQTDIERDFSVSTSELIIDAFRKTRKNEAAREIDHHIVRALGYTDSEAAAEILISWKCSESYRSEMGIEKTILNSMENLGSKAWVPLINALSQSSHGECPDRLYGILGRIDFMGAPDDIESKLLVLTESKNQKMRYAAFASLRTIRTFPLGTMPKLYEVIHSGTRDVPFFRWLVLIYVNATYMPQYSASSADLALQKDIKSSLKEASSLLLEMKTSWPNEELRKNYEKEKINAVEAFGLLRLPFPEVVEALIQVLDREKLPKVRIAAAEALGRLKAKEAIPSLEKALQDKDAEVVRQSRQALRRIKSK